MVGEKGENIGHIHRKLISSVAWEQLDQLKIKSDVENNCETSLDNSKLLCKKPIPIAKYLATDSVYQNPTGNIMMHVSNNKTKL